MMQRDRNKVAILDRDGTIIVDRHYLNDPEGIEFEAGAVEGLRAMTALGYRLVIVTNQSGIARGLLDVERLEEIHERLRRMLADVDVQLDGIYFCPHGPADGCECRKPKLGLMRRAVDELHFDAADAVVIGDKDSDVEFGRRAGALTMLIDAASGSAGTRADHVVRDLSEAAQILRRIERR
jgi:D-glycero-D-manno-heptose 1,7-bisphosphate phosphatase